MTDFKFSKSERLKGRKYVEHLFQTGKSVYKYPIRVVYNYDPKGIDDNVPAGSQLKVAFSVPKRKIRSAVKRNLIRRRVKEAYRLNRNQIIVSSSVDLNQHQLHLIFIYQHTEILDYKVIEKSVEKLLKAVLNSAE
jgi:ribonuclease P protein component